MEGLPEYLGGEKVVNLRALPWFGEAGCVASECSEAGSLIRRSFVGESILAHTVYLALATSLAAGCSES